MPGQCVVAICSSSGSDVAEFRTLIVDAFGGATAKTVRRRYGDLTPKQLEALKWCSGELLTAPVYAVELNRCQTDAKLQEAVALLKSRVGDYKVAVAADVASFFSDDEELEFEPPGKETFVVSLRSHNAADRNFLETALSQLPARTVSEASCTVFGSLAQDQKQLLQWTEDLSQFEHEVRKKLELTPIVSYLVDGTHGTAVTELESNLKAEFGSSKFKIYKCSDAKTFFEDLKGYDKATQHEVKATEETTFIVSLRSHNGTDQHFLESALSQFLAQSVSKASSTFNCLTQEQKHALEWTEDLSQFDPEVREKLESMPVVSYLVKGARNTAAPELKSKLQDEFGRSKFKIYKRSDAGAFFAGLTGPRSEHRARKHEVTFVVSLRTHSEADQHFLENALFQLSTKSLSKTASRFDCLTQHQKEALQWTEDLAKFDPELREKLALTPVVSYLVDGTDETTAIDLEVKLENEFGSSKFEIYKRSDASTFFEDLKGDKLQMLPETKGAEGTTFVVSLRSHNATDQHFLETSLSQLSAQSISTAAGTFNCLTQRQKQILQWTEDLSQFDPEVREKLESIPVVSYLVEGAQATAVSHLESTLEEELGSSKFELYKNSDAAVFFRDLARTGKDTETFACTVPIYKSARLSHEVKVEVSRPKTAGGASLRSRQRRRGIKRPSTGEIRYHAEAQTDESFLRARFEQLHPCVQSDYSFKNVSRDAQTVDTLTRSTLCTKTVATQMVRRGVCLRDPAVDEREVVVDPRNYVTASKVMRAREEACVTIQCARRRQLALRKVKQLRHERDLRAAEEKRWAGLRKQCADHAALEASLLFAAVEEKVTRLEKRRHANEVVPREVFKKLRREIDTTFNDRRVKVANDSEKTRLSLEQTELVRRLEYAMNAQMTRQAKQRQMRKLSTIADDRVIECETTGPLGEVEQVRLLVENEDIRRARYLYDLACKLRPSLKTRVPSQERADTLLKAKWSVIAFEKRFYDNVDKRQLTEEDERLKSLSTKDWQSHSLCLTTDEYKAWKRLRNPAVGAWTGANANRAREFVELCEQELDGIARQRPYSAFIGLRERIYWLFEQLASDLRFNPRLERLPKRKVKAPLRFRPVADESGKSEVRSLHNMYTGSQQTPASRSPPANIESLH
ncbi:MAG: hypothetical protein MHM6MM_000404 [Cercozoa sp. M6MM]